MLEKVTYGLALALSFALGIGVATSRARRHGIDPELVLELGIGIVLCSLLGSRLLWVVTHREVFQGPGASWADAFSLSGLSMQGGIVLAVGFSVAWIGYRGAPLLRTIDVLAPSVALGEGITRLLEGDAALTFDRGAGLRLVDVARPETPAG